MEEIPSVVECSNRVERVCGSLRHSLDKAKELTSISFATPALMHTGGDKDQRKEISQLFSETYYDMVDLRNAFRQMFSGVRECQRRAEAQVRALETETVRLQSLEYQREHILREIDEIEKLCDVDLEVENVEARPLPASIRRGLGEEEECGDMAVEETIGGIHGDVRDRLRAEETKRTEIQTTIEEVQEEKASVAKDVVSLEQFLESLPTIEKAIWESAQPLFKHMNLPTSALVPEVGCSLPATLARLFSQLHGSTLDDVADCSIGVVAVDGSDLDSWRVSVDLSSPSSSQLVMTCPDKHSGVFTLRLRERHAGLVEVTGEWTHPDGNGGNERDIEWEQTSMIRDWRRVCWGVERHFGNEWMPAEYDTQGESDDGWMIYGWIQRVCGRLPRTSGPQSIVRVDEMLTVLTEQIERWSNMAHMLFSLSADGQSSTGPKSSIVRDSTRWPKEIQITRVDFQPEEESVVVCCANMEVPRSLCVRVHLPLLADEDGWTVSVDMMQWERVMHRLLGPPDHSMTMVDPTTKDAIELQGSSSIPYETLYISEMVKREWSAQATTTLSYQRIEQILVLVAHFLRRGVVESCTIRETSSFPHLISGKHRVFDIAHVLEVQPTT
eukprot:TRINITY_DN48_c0_g1_i1.p1 TRINITY_DN48_c0_g1~~TRINITY_DN48_c0_g1_i1.p1  ORF type:complete len:613 (+),score=162.25 TRINITY_DN48_c0_g1_i1:139-1977(+)